MEDRASLIEESIARARENDRVILHVLAAGPASSAEVSRVSEIPERTVQRRLTSLAGTGAVRRSGRAWCLTPAGAAALEAGAGAGVGAGLDLAAAWDMFPAPEHGALGRLALGAIIAKRHLRGLGPGWPAFAIFGPTASLKTVTGRVLARMIGVDEARTVLLVADRSERELIGRRVQGRDGWRFEPSPALSAPFLVLDEIDKAPADLRRAVLRVLQGDDALAIEDEVHAFAPIVFGTSNAPDATLSEAYRRRSVLLDTGALGIEPAAADEAARRLLAPGALPLLDVDGLAPAVRSLPEGERAFLGRTLRGYLTEEGSRLFDAEALSRCAIGATALVPDPGRAVRETALAFLQCAVTVGHAPPDAPGRFAAEHLAGVDVGTLARTRAERDREARRVVVEQRVAFVESRAGGASIFARYARALSSTDPAERAAQAGLDELARMTRGARSEEELVAIGEVGRERVGRAEQALARREAGRYAAAPGSFFGRSPSRAHTVAAVPDRLALVRTLAEVGSPEPPVTVLSGLGLLRPDPLPRPGPAGQRWRATSPRLTGHNVWGSEGWGSPGVRAVLAAEEERLAAERGPRPVPETPALPAGSPAPEEPGYL